MSAPGWNFKRLTPGDTRTNATHLEFFRDDALENPADAFVREDIQNRLDARRSGFDTVRVSYRFRQGTGAVPSDAAGFWLNGLAAHLEAKASREELDEMPDLKTGIPHLVAEDFHTTGLEGDPTITQDPEDPDIRNDFYWFVRNVGRSGKHGSDRGRWGLGKIVYPATSKARSFYAFTVRESDRRSLLVGRSVLAVHRIGNEDYESEGYFGEFNSTEFPDFCTPVEDSTIVDRFRRDFGIARTNDEPGLSIVIPWPHQNINATSVSQSVVLHYFDEILRGNLIVEIADDAGFHALFQKADFERAVRDLPGVDESARKDLLGRLRFARLARSHDLPENCHHQLVPEKPRWQDMETAFASEEVVNVAKAAYRAGELLRFDIPVRVNREGDGREEGGHFSVFLQRNEQSSQSTETFIRDGLTISGLHMLREPGVTALTLVEDNPLSTLLGDAENPAHTTWVQTTKHFRGKYKLGPTILSFVKNAASQIAGFLGRSDAKLDEDLLQHLFSLPLNEGSKLPKKKKKPGQEPPTPPEDLPPAKPRAFAVAPVASGFTLRPTGLTPPPKTIVVRAAYETLRGNPFNQHHPADFDFSAEDSGLAYHGNGVDLRMEQPNLMRVEITNPDFQLSVTGFDPNRDLIVNARAVAAPSDPTTEEAEGDEV